MPAGSGLLAKLLEPRLPGRGALSRFTARLMGLVGKVSSRFFGGQLDLRVAAKYLGSEEVGSSGLGLRTNLYMDSLPGR